MPITKAQSIRPNRRSHNAEGVARDLIANIQSRKKINLTKLQVSNGYSIASAKSQKAMRTESFKAIIVPVITRMENLRDKTLKALQNKDLDKATLYDLTQLLKTTNHDLQLLTGKATENVATTPTVIVYGSEDFLSKQMARQSGLDK